MAFSLQLLQHKLEAIEAGLTHTKHCIASFGLPEIRSTTGAGSVQDIQLAVHISDHEIFPLQDKKEDGTGSEHRKHAGAMSSYANLHQVVLQCGLTDASHRVVGLQQVIMDLELLPAVIPGGTTCRRR